MISKYHEILNTKLKNLYGKIGNINSNFKLWIFIAEYIKIQFGYITSLI